MHEQVICRMTFIFTLPFSVIPNCRRVNLEYAADIFHSVLIYSIFWTALAKVTWKVSTRIFVSLYIIDVSYKFKNKTIINNHLEKTVIASVTIGSDILQIFNTLFCTFA